MNIVSRFYEEKERLCCIQRIKTSQRKSKKLRDKNKNVDSVMEGVHNRHC